MRSFIHLLLACSVLVFTASSFAKGAQPVNMKYAGYNHDLAMDLNGDGYPANLSAAEGRGTFGNSTIAISAEFVPDQDQLVNCSDEFELAFSVVPDNYWAFTVTAADYSQVYGLFNSGWMCATGDMLRWEGQTQGIYFDGSGRYEGVYGEWVSDYRGMNLDPVTGLRSISGEVHGMLYFD